MFLLTMGLFGFMMNRNAADNQAVFLVSVALFILIAFVSVLLHELGHALTGRRFTNSPVEVVLESFGGHARFLSPRFTKRQYILMTAAGPLMNFVLAGIFLSIHFFVIPNIDMVPNSLLARFIVIAGIINIFWGLFNLVPVFPLDGGHIMHSFIKNPYKAHRASFVIGLVVIGLGIMRGELIAVMFFALMAFQNYQIMSAMNRR